MPLEYFTASSRFGLPALAEDFRWVDFLGDNEVAFALATIHQHQADLPPIIMEVLAQQRQNLVSENHDQIVQAAGVDEVGVANPVIAVE